MLHYKCHEFYLSSFMYVSIFHIFMINSETNKKYETYVLNIVLYHTILKCHGHFRKQLINSYLITPKVASKKSILAEEHTKTLRGVNYLNISFIII